MSLPAPFLPTPFPPISAPPAPEPRHDGHPGPRHEVHLRSSVTRIGRRLAALLRAAAARLTSDDRGMSTVEYAIGTLAAAAFAAVLYTVISGDSIVTALTQLVQRALSVTF
ncbi:DUF4244 domain-containing protein [Pseudonocardia sp. RS010]|uniref:DUF4244 domain-containing protein n=1 Tax=Pseudonocardia sp. RS010 TaxID=3385979 RepID=UPI0039A117D6